MANLNNVKVGDKLHVINGSLGWHIEIVARVLKRHVVTAIGTKFRMDGSQVTDDTWHHKYATPITDSEIEKLKAKERAKKERNELIWKCSKIEFKSLPTEKLKQILNVIEA